MVDEGLLELEVGCVESILAGFQVRLEGVVENVPFLHVAAGPQDLAVKKY